MLTQQRLKELFNYDPETGRFIRLVGRSGPGARAGDVAGCDNGQGYIRIYVDGKGYKAHRLAWLYVYGDLPAEIDHVNCDRSDNRIGNLRPATRKQNRSNCAAYRNNTSGYKGVSACGEKWRAQIQSGGKKKALGLFRTPEEAHEAYVAAAKEWHGQFARAA